MATKEIKYWSNPEPMAKRMLADPSFNLFLLLHPISNYHFEKFWKKVILYADQPLEEAK